MKQPRRILLVSSGSALYGAEQSLLHVIRKFDPAAWQPHFVIPGPGPFEQAARDAGYPVSLFDVTVGQGQGRLSELPTVLRLAALIRRLRADLVHLNLHFSWPIVSAACQLARVPLVVHVRNMLGPEQHGRLNSFLFRRIDGVICISDAVRRRLFESGLPGAAPTFRVHQVADARDLSTFRGGDRTRIREELQVAPQAPLIGMVARLERMKGQDLFLEACQLVAERLPEARFVLVGDTMVESQRPFQAQLEALASEPPLAGRVSFLGYRTDIPDVLAGLDCFVHSSRRGAFVSVLIEAMAAGVPIVASEVDGIPECVGRDGQAELVSTLEPAAFADAILRVVTDRERARSMSTAGRERALRHFDVGPLARATEEILGQHALSR